MWKISTCFLIINFYAFGQSIEVIDDSNFRIDSLSFNVSGIRYIKKINAPFIRGGDGKFARKSQISFDLKHSSSLSFSIGDSAYIEDLLLFKKSLTEYYSFFDTSTDSEGRTLHRYALKSDPKSTLYYLTIRPFYIGNKAYFVLIDTDSKDLSYADQLIRDLQRQNQ